MKKRKIAAALLAVSMLAGLFAGCSKTTNLTTEKFISACEKMGLKEFDFDGEFPSTRDVEKGFYMASDAKETEDLLEDSMGNSLEEISAAAGLSDIVNSDSVKSLGIAVKVDGYKDLKKVHLDELEDLELDGAIAIQMTLDDNYSEDFSEYISDMLDMYDISTDDLTDKEFYTSKNESYLRLHLNVADFMQLVLDNDDITTFAEAGMSDDLEDVIGNLTGDAALSVEVHGTNVLVVAGFSVNKDPDILKDFIKKFGVSADPLKLPMNENFAGGIIDSLAEYLFASMLTDITDGGNNIPGNKNVTIGISMPTKDLQRWNQDGERMKEQLERNGFTVDLQYASNDTRTQAAQIEDMINSGCKLLIIAAIESSSLSAVLDMAASKNIPVIAYDRLIMDTENIDYYVSFDNYLVGVLQASYIISALDIDNNRGPFNIELTAGDPSDVNARLFYNGAYDMLSPYIASGNIKVVSGQTAFEDVATKNWTTENAKARAENIISAYYNVYPDGINIDAWLCSNDSTAWGVTQALESANYKGTYPIITGQDCDLVNVKNIINGKQAMSVFKDTRTLVDQTVEMAIEIVEGRVVDVNDTSTYNNGVKTVPSYLCEPVFVDKNNYKDILIDSGYYQESDLI